MEIVYHPVLLWSLSEKSFSYYEIKVSWLEVMNIREKHIISSRDATIRYLCDHFDIKYSHLKTVEVREKTLEYRAASIYLVIKPEYEHIYAVRENTIHSGASCQSQPVKKDVLMKRKRRSITLV